MKYITKIIGRHEYKIQDGEFVCIMCLGKGSVTRRTRMNNNFQSEEYEASCQHCITHKEKTSEVIDKRSKF